MASIIREIDLAAPAAFTWDAIADIGAPHRRLARGFVAETRLDADGGAREITFGNGLSARELVVSLDHARRRFAYSIVAGRATHHNASMEVIEREAGHCRLRWITDVLPHDLEEPFTRMIDAGVAALRQTIEGDYAAA